MTMVIESLPAVTMCPVCGGEMSTSMKCDVCNKWMCCECGKKHECELKEEPKNG